MIVFLINAHWFNRGDESAIKTMIYSLKKKDNLINFIVQIHGNRDFIEQDPFFKVIPDNFIINSARKTEILKIYLDLLLIFLTCGRFSLSREGRLFIKTLRSADIVVHAPSGPSIGDYYPQLEMVSLFRILIAIFCGKKIVMYSPSLGPFDNKKRNWVRFFILSRIKSIFVRDTQSCRMLMENLHIKSILSVDAAFQETAFALCDESRSIPHSHSLITITEDKEIKELLCFIENNKVVGLVPTELKWHYSYLSDEQIQKKINHFIDFVIGHLHEKGYKILLLPQIFDVPVDLELFHSIISKYPFVQVMSPRFDVFYQQFIISKLFCMVSFRYHPVVFCIKNSIPFIAISYEFKTTDLVSRCEMVPYSMDVKQIDSDIFIQMFSKLEKEYFQIKEKLSVSNHHFSILSHQPNIIIEDYLNGKKISNKPVNDAGFSRYTKWNEEYHKQKQRLNYDQSPVRYKLNGESASIIFSDGWYPIETNNTESWLWMGLYGTIHVNFAKKGMYCLEFSLVSYLKERELQILCGDTLLASFNVSIELKSYKFALNSSREKVSIILKCSEEPDKPYIITKYGNIDIRSLSVACYQLNVHPLI